MILSKLVSIAATHASAHLRPHRRSAAVAVAIAALAATLPASAQQPPPPRALPQADIAGLWVDHTGRGAVEIGPCGPAGKLCGHIVWLQTTVDEKGKPLVDHKNPDARKQRQPICGAQVIGDLSPVGQSQAGNVWGSGWIYDPEKGQSFDVEIKLVGPDRLSVMGYAGFRFLSETFIWRRAPAQLAAARCIGTRT